LINNKTYRIDKRVAENGISQIDYNIKLTTGEDLTSKAGESYIGHIVDNGLVKTSFKTTGSLFNKP